MKQIKDYTVKEAIELVEDFPIVPTAGNIICLLLEPPRRKTLVQEDVTIKLDEAISKDKALRHFDLGPRLALVVKVGKGRVLRDEAEDLEVKPYDIVLLGTGMFSWLVYEGIIYTNVNKHLITGYIDSQSPKYKEYFDLNFYNDVK